MQTEDNGDIEVQKLSKQIKVEEESRRRHHHSCGFSREASHESESEDRSKSARKLGGLIVFCLIFILVEIVGGIKANSLAVLTDAAHLLTDIFGFAVSLFSVWASGWVATPRHSYGFFRLEVLGALFSVQLIWLITGIIVYEAIERILKKDAVVNGKLMFMTAVFGFLINIVMVIWLGHDHTHHHHHHSCSSEEHDHGTEEHDRSIGETIKLVSSHTHDHHCDTANHQHENSKWMQKMKQKHQNMNVQGAYLHVLGDLIQSIGVMIGGLIIWAKPDWFIVDLVCTLCFSVLVLLTTIGLIKNILAILMQSTPSEIDMAKVEIDLKSMEGVHDVDDLHVWAMSTGKLVLSCHVTTEPGINSKEILVRIREYCEKVYGIHHVTVQIEEE